MSLLKKYTSLLIVLLSVSKLSAQSSGYTFCEWDKINVNVDYVPGKEDTALVFVSTRNYHPGKPECVDYDLDTTSALHYFNVYFNHNKWICVPQNNLEAALANVAKNKDMVVYVEGMGKDFTANVDRATRFTRIYDVVTIMFDWPTYRPYLSGGKNYKVARLQSKKISKCLSNFFNELSKAKAGNNEFPKMSLMLHSLGNRLIKEAVINDHIEVKEKLFDNVVLNAACVKMRGHKNWLEKLTIQDKIYVTRNNHDRTLNLARAAALSKRLGMHARWRKAKNAVYLDFSEVLSVEHNYFLMNNVLSKHPEIKAIYSAVFHGKAPNFDDEFKFRTRRNRTIVTIIGPLDDSGLGLSL